MGRCRAPLGAPRHPPHARARCGACTALAQSWGAPTGCSDIDVKALTSVNVTVAWLDSPLGRCSGSGLAFSLRCLLCRSYNR